MSNKIEKNVVSDKDLENVSGGNTSIEKTVDAVTNSPIWDIAAEKISETISTFWSALKYIWSK